MKRSPILFVGTFLFLVVARWGIASEETTLKIDDLSDKPQSFVAADALDDPGQYTFWLPAGADELVLPISAGVVIDTSRSDLMTWLRDHSPWGLGEIPVVGLRYGDQIVTVIIPWPQYAEIVINDRVGIQFALPPGRANAAPVEIVATRHATVDPLEVARVFRQWRATAPETGAIPKPRPLSQKIKDLPATERLLGAPHIYLWGPALFCSQDIRKDKLLSFAKSLETASPRSIGGRLKELFTEEQLASLHELATGNVLKPYTLAGAIDSALSRPELLGLSVDTPPQEILAKNRQAFAAAYADSLMPVETWGDGASFPLLSALKESGIDRALLLLSDLYQRSVRPDVAAYANDSGYLYGPYDSYHSIHSPDANDTWETAQFDEAAFKSGAVINADGTGHQGFLGRGFHFAPQVAWPYVKRRVGGILDQAPYSAWFIDCDATAECFEDYSPEHPTTKVKDTTLRRERLKWLESERKMVVGSEGGSVLFADLIHFGHGVHTPYIIHLEPAFRDHESPYFLGGYFPPGAPAREFQPTPIPPSVKTPYFDPTVRIPLYQAAVGDEVINTHHWSMDSLKFSDIAQVRELMEILYMVPPMYHLNRENWPLRQDRIVAHFKFWSPLHRQLATAPLTSFEYLSDDKLVQRATYQTAQGLVTVTVNFADSAHGEHAPFSATVAGSIELDERVYAAK